MISLCRACFLYFIKDSPDKAVDIVVEGCNSVGGGVCKGERVLLPLVIRPAGRSKLLS